MSALPRPPYTAHTSDDLVAIPYPPPPARIETVPEPSDARAVWVGGEWSWNGRRWGWRRGRWVIPPQGAAFAPWQAVRGPTGELYFAPGIWRGADGGTVDEPPAVGEARGTRLSIVNLDGEDEPTGADIRPERSAARDAGPDGRARARNRENAPETSMDAGGP